MLPFYVKHFLTALSIIKLQDCWEERKWCGPHAQGSEDHSEVNICIEPETGQWSGTHWKVETGSLVWSVLGTAAALSHPTALTTALVLFYLFFILWPQWCFILSMCSNSGLTANIDGDLVEEWKLTFPGKGGPEVCDAILGGCGSQVRSPVLSCLTEDRWHWEKLCEQSHTFLNDSVNLVSMFPLQKELLQMK